MGYNRYATEKRRKENKIGLIKVIQLILRFGTLEPCRRFP